MVTFVCIRYKDWHGMYRYLLLNRDWSRFFFWAKKKIQNAQLIYKSPPRLRLFTKGREESFLAFKWFMDTNWRVRFHKRFLLYFCQPISFHLPLFTVKVSFDPFVEQHQKNFTTAVTSQKKTAISSTLEGNILHLTKAKKRTMFCLFKIPISWKIRGKQICYLEAIFTYLKIVVTSIKVARFQNFTQA